ARRLSASEMQRCGRERARHLNVDRAVRVDRPAACRRELAQPCAVGRHREDLGAERVAADGIAAGREQHGSGDPVAHDAEGGDAAAAAIGREARELAQVATESVDGEELADPGRILAEGIGRRYEERPATSDEGAAYTSVGAAELGQLQKLLAIEQEELEHHVYARLRVYGGPVGIRDQDGL